MIVTVNTEDLRPIGTRRFIAAGGPEPLYLDSPFFGIRRQFLPMVNRVCLQVLVAAFGDLVWINTEPSDLKILPIFQP